MLKISSKFFLLTFVLFFVNCSSIPSLMEEPAQPVITEETDDITTLIKYETDLNGYVMYLMEFLVTTKKKVQDKEYPKFTLFDATLLRNNGNIEDIEFNIILYQDYIKQTKPIAQYVYQKYSKLYMLKNK